MKVDIKEAKILHPNLVSEWITGERERRAEIQDNSWGFA